MDTSGFDILDLWSDFRTTIHLNPWGFYYRRVIPICSLLMISCCWYAMAVLITGVFPCNQWCTLWYFCISSLCVCEEGSFVCTSIGTFYPSQIVQLNFLGPMNSLKYKVFWWIWLPMGSLKKFSRVVLMTTLGNNIYMQISAAIIENRIFINNFFIINNQVSKMVSTPIFSWSRITMNIFMEL